MSYQAIADRVTVLSWIIPSCCAWLHTVVPLQTFLSSGDISVPNSDVSAGSSRFSAPRTALMAQEYIQPGTGRLCSPVTSLAVVKQ